MPNAAEMTSTDAFALIVNRHSPMVLGVCRRMLGNVEAEDAAQAVFVLFWQKQKQFPDDSIIAGWLHRTARHVCRNAMRSRISRINHEQEAGVELAALKSEVATMRLDSAEWSEIRQVLDDEVNRLPDKLRIPFVLFHLENHPVAEVAAILGSTVPTIGTWLRRSREKLAVSLRKRGIVLGAAAFAELLSQHAVAETVAAEFVATTVQIVSSFAVNGLATSTACSPAIASLVKAGAAGGMGKAVWIIAGSLAALLIGVPLAAFWFFPMMQTRNSADFPLLQGEWREVAVEQDGGPSDNKVPVEYVGSFVISGRDFHRFQTLADGRVLGSERGTFVLDDSRRPRMIDFKLTFGTIHGIYEIDGDALTLCATSEGGPHPSDFATTKNDRRRLTKYQRIK
jgi:RNA polymerase sigma factor (sigma-70 family)